MSQPLLVVGPSWVGDMVMAQSLFKVLHQQNPERAIDVLAPSWSHPLLQRMPEIRKGIEMPVGHGSLQWRVRRLLAMKLKKENYGEAIVLPNSFKSALIPWFAKIPKRTGWLGEMRYGLLNNKQTLDKAKWPLMIQRFVALAENFSDQVKSKTEIPWPKLAIDANNQRQAAEKFSLDTQKPILALCPGAEFGPAKRWPSNYYAEVAAHYIERGFLVWIFGSEKDKPVAGEICAAIDNADSVNILCGKTSLAEAIDLMSMATLVVSNDSGLMHIAAALQKPIAVPYGSTSAQFTPPLAEQVEIVSLGLACSPCFKRECPLQHTNCLKQLKSHLILDALSRLEKTQAAKK